MRATASVSGAASVSTRRHPLLRRILILTLLLTLLIGPVPVRAAGDGSIRGVMVNGSANGTAVAGIEISLTVFDDMKAAADFKTNIDADGNYEFTGLETDSVFAYRLETSFAEMSYDSGFLQFTEGETVIPWDIMVFDTTTDGSVVSLAMAHVIMAAGEGYLSVTEYHIVVNESDLAYIGAEVGDGTREVLRFGIPAGASALEFNEGLTDVRIWPDGSGFSDGVPLRPSKDGRGREVVFTYLIPFTGEEKPIGLGFDYPVSTLNLLVENRGIEVTTTLVAGEPLVMGSSQYLVFTGSGIAAGEMFILTLKAAGGSGGGIGVWVWVLLTLAVGGGGVLIWLRRRTAPEFEAEDDTVDSVVLLQSLARLDDDFEAGKIAEADYRRQRAEVKQQLVSLMRPDGGEDTP